MELDASNMDVDEDIDELDPTSDEEGEAEAGEGRDDLPIPKQSRRSGAKGTTASTSTSTSRRRQGQGKQAKASSSSLVPPEMTRAESGNGSEKVYMSEGDFEYEEDDGSRPGGRWKCLWSDCTMEFGTQGTLVKHLQRGEFMLEHACIRSLMFRVRVVSAWPLMTGIVFHVSRSLHDGDA